MFNPATARPTNHMDGFMVDADPEPRGHFGTGLATRCIAISEYGERGSGRGRN